MKERDQHVKTMGAPPSPWTQSVERVLTNSFHIAKDTLSGKFRSATPERQSELEPNKIAITSRRKIVFVDLADVITVEARCNYVVLRTVSRAHALRQPISAIAESLRRYGFIRIHRSTIMNGA